MARSIARWWPPLPAIEDGRASGSGKSSLVLAGLVPALQTQNPNLVVRYLTPTSHPVTQLENALADVPTDQPHLIVVDQFEELFTLCSDAAQRQAFLDRLLSLLAAQKSKIENQKSSSPCAPTSGANAPASPICAN